MSDLYHESLPFSAIDEVWQAMKAAPWHTYQVLTKRADRLVEWAMSTNSRFNDLLEHCREFVWVGVSAEDQETWDARVGKLLELTSVFHGVLWVSVEPLLGPIDPSPPYHEVNGLGYGRGTNVNLDGWLQQLDWMVVGGESGPGARPMKVEWARSLRDRAVGRTDTGRPWSLPFHFKQWGEFDAKGERVGRPAAGHLLDGVEWREMPRNLAWRRQ